MSYNSSQINQILLKADKTLYKLGSDAYLKMFSEDDETWDYERDIIFIYKAAVEWADDYFIGQTKLNQIIERLAAKLNIYDYGILAPIYVDVVEQQNQIIQQYVLKSTQLVLGSGLTGSSDFSQSSVNISLNYGYLDTIYVPDTRTLTINGITYDLSANRSWSVGTGTVTSVDMSVPTGFSISGNPVTSSGTLALGFASGYSLPTNVKQSNWDDAYTWVSNFPSQTGNSGKFLTTDGSVLSWGTVNLTGYVPYTGATQNVDLGEYEIKAGQFTLDLSPTGTAAVGTTRWNNTIGSTETTLKGGNVILKNGVDLVARVVNKVTPNATLTKAQYQAVRVTGAQGQRLAVAYAQANNDNNSADTIGLVIETIPTNQEGFIITVGQIEGINTTGSLQGETWTDGDVLYLSPTTPGALTNVKPVAPQHIVVMGYVEYAHANNGKIYVKVMNGWELGELHDVNTNGAVAGQVLKYNGTIWAPATDAEGTNIYNSDGTLTGNRTVTMGSYSLAFTKDITVNYVTVGAGINTTYGNTILGKEAMFSDVSSDDNVAIGTNAMYAATAARGNTAVGNYVLDSITTGERNAAFGVQALTQVTTGYANVGIGYYAGQNVSTGQYNIFIGHQSGQGLNTGSSNIAIGNIGFSSLNAASNYNTLIGNGLNLAALGQIDNNIILTDGQGNIKYRWDGTTTNLYSNSIVHGTLGVNTTTVGSQIQVNGNAAIGYSASTAAPSNGLTVAGNTLIGGTTDFTPSRLQVYNSTSSTSSSIYGGFASSTVTYAGGSTLSGGVVANGFQGSVSYNFGGNVTIPNSVVTAGLIAVSDFKFTGSGTVTHNQAGSGVRAMSNIFSMWTHTSGLSGTVSHVANIRLVAPFSGSAGTVTLTNYYGILIEDSSQFPKFSITNKWGIFQEGTGDRNSFAGRSLWGSTVDDGVNMIQVTGSGKFSSTLTANSFVKTGGTSSQYLMADGSTSTLPSPTNIYTSDGTLSGNRTLSSGGFTLAINAATTFGENLSITKNGNFATRVDVTNTTSAANNVTLFGITSDAGAGGSYFGKYSTGATAYKTLAAKDLAIFNTAGDISILNDGGSGKIKFTAGGASTAQMTLTAAGRLLLGTSIEGTNLLDVNGTARVQGQTTISATSSASLTNGLTTTLSAGYTGSGRTDAIIGTNSAAGTGVDLNTPSLNAGGSFASIGTTSGYNAGGRFIAFGSSSFNIGFYGDSTVNNTGSNIGAFARAYNNTAGVKYVGGYFVNSISSTVPTISANSALIADSGGYTGSNIFIGQSNGTALFIINNSGGVGVGTSSINSSARVQIDSTTQGFLPPRMTAAQKNAISSPAAGLIIYQTDGTVGLYLYDGTAWRALAMV